MRSQADRDEVTLDIARALTFAVFAGAVVTLVAWAVDCAVDVGGDQNSIFGTALLLGAAALVGRFARARRR